jgi:hypothetical protein
MNIFSLNGSPPRIAAFLGIGIFTVAMTIVFAWRRMNRGRLLVHPVRPAPRAAKKSIVLGEKPTLWDFWTQREDGVTVDTRWENITVRLSSAVGEKVIVLIFDSPTLALFRDAVLSDRACVDQDERC